VQPPPPVAENDADEDHTEGPEDDGPVHRRLIRATLPRPEGQPPERKPPEFTRPGARTGLQREPSRRRWRTTSRSRTSRSPRRAELVQRSLALRDAETEFAARRTTRQRQPSWSRRRSAWRTAAGSISRPGRKRGR
jgi:hypothetical protein